MASWNTTQRLPVRSHSNGRPLPVTAVASSPGPQYNIPSTIGNGPKIKFKHRYVDEEELMPMPGPGEYDPDGSTKWNTAPGFSFSAPPNRDPAQEVHREKPPTQSEITKAEPGPGFYTNDSLNISRRPTERSGWRVQGMDTTNPKKLMHTGASIGSPRVKKKFETGVPGPGSYTPARDNKGHRVLGSYQKNRISTMKAPARSEKRTDDMAAPGPGAYDTSRFNIAKQAVNHPITMPGRPFDTETERPPGPGHYTARTASVTKRVHGPRFVPAPPPRKRDQGVPGPGEYNLGSTLGSKGMGITFKHRHVKTSRSPRCPHIVGEVVAVQISQCGPPLKGTIKESWNGDTEETAMCYRVMLETGVERDVEGHQVSIWKGGMGPGAYEPTGGVGKNGPKYTIQGPCTFTSMAVSEARKTRDNPGPDQYFKQGTMHKGIGTGGHKVTIAHKTEVKQHQCDVGPGGGPSGNYEPKHPSNFQPYSEFAPGVSLGSRASVFVRVLPEVDEVKMLCDDNGIVEWKGGKEWTQNRHSDQAGDEICKDDYCGMEGVFVQQGGVLRCKAPPNVSGPNRGYNKKVPNAPWSAWSNKSKDSIRIIFDDGVCWTYPPAALFRHGLPFDKANARWPIPQTAADGPSSGATSDELGKSFSPKITISGKPLEVVPLVEPGPGHYDITSGLSDRAAVIGTSQ